MTPESSANSAGALLKAAREKQGLHVAALAASIKVSPRKLEALEADRYDELQGPAFTRALAQSVCRVLRIDPGPVLAQLPRASASDLENVAGTLNTPFRDRPSRDEGVVVLWAQRALVAAGVGLLLAAAVTYLLPTSWWRQSAEPVLAGAAGAASAVVSEVLPQLPVRTDAPPSSAAPDPAAPTEAASQPSVAVTHLAPVDGTTLAPTTAAQPAPNTAAPTAAASSKGILQLSVAEGSWIEVRDAQGRLLLSRTVQPGEAVGVDGALPMRVVVGNAAATLVRFRDQPVELTAVTRDNVARLELR